MAIEFSCTSCGRKYRVADNLAGKRAACKACAQPMTIPLPPPPEDDGTIPLKDLEDADAAARSAPTVAYTPPPAYTQPMRPRATATQSESPSTLSQMLRNPKLRALAVLPLIVLTLVLAWPRIRSQPLSRLNSGRQARPASSGTLPSADLLRLGTGPGPTLSFAPFEDDLQLAQAWIGDGPGGAQTNMQVYVYLPANQSKPKSLGCVFIAPAGTNLITGMELGEGDMDEHIPYAKAGFAVVAYTLSGFGPEGPLNLKRNIELFVASDGGLLNARRAIDYTLLRVPQVDPQRLYVAGHSSAATVALRVAAKDKRIKACIAYAPATDVTAHLTRAGGNAGINALERMIPGIRAFMWDISPVNFAAELTCPTYLFHTLDDEVVPVNDSKKLAALRPGVIKLITPPTGDHYEAMIETGLPGAIQWLKSIDAK